MTDRTNPPLAWAPSPLAGDTPRRDDGWIVVAVMVLGGLVAAQALLGLLGTIGTSFVGTSKGGTALASAFGVAYVTLGIGLVLRREVARQVYVVVAAIAVILLAFVGAPLAASSSGHASSSAAQTAYMQAQTKAEINKIQDDRFLSAATKQQEIREVTRTEEIGKSLTDATNGAYGALLRSFLLAFIGLVFFTRPAVKKVFD